MNKPLFLLFFVFVLVGVVSPAYAARSFDVTEVPTYVEEQFGIVGSDGFIGGLIASVALLVIVMLPLIYLTRGKAYSLYIIFSLLTLAPLVGLGWVPIWLYIIVLLLIAMGFGKELAKFLGGLGK